MLISYRAFLPPPPDALSQDSGQLTEFQADKFGHPGGPCMGFLQGGSKDAVVFQKGY